MASRILRAFLGVSLAGVALYGATTALSAAVRPPRLEYQIATLPNGLTVVMEEDHSTPIVHAQLWYHVGSRNEKAGRTGFAHLFEHLMFKGSKNVDPEGHTSMIASIGGQSNAYTQDDVTVFWETVPAQYLPINGWSMAAPRIYFAQAQDGLFFRRFAAIHPRFQTPHLAILMFGAWSALLAITGTYETLAAYAMFAAWVFMG